MAVLTGMSLLRMASRGSRVLVNSRAAFSSTPVIRSDDPSKALFKREARQITLDDAAKTVSELEHEKALKGLITVEGPVDVSLVSGVPEEHTKERYVRIYRPAKNPMQSGTANIKKWKIDFETRQRWENNLMGWASSGDPLSNMQVEFASQEEAIAFVEKNGWDYWVEKASEKQPKAKSYALNFAWNKRTRKSTK